MLDAEKAYGDFLKTLILIGIYDRDLVLDDDGKLFYFMRGLEFDFCDKWGLK